jgi:hypothetical protein
MARTGLLDKRLLVQRLGVLCSFPSRLGAIVTAQALLHLGRVFVQLDRTQMGGKLAFLRPRSPLPRSPFWIRLVHRPSPARPTRRSI